MKAHFLLSELFSEFEEVTSEAKAAILLLYKQSKLVPAIINGQNATGMTTNHSLIMNDF